MTYHFIGLGGIGMSALARVLLQRGHKVQGSDIRTSALLKALETEGAHVEVGHRVETLEGATTVIYSTDIKEDNVELMRAKEQKLPLLHRSDLLHELMKGKKPLLVTGTHGKTTTTALLASVLMEADLDPSFVVGGLLRSLRTNGKAGKGDLFVAEADESDGSFLKTPAFAAIITNLDNDHLDYWGSERVLDLAFRQFIAQTTHLFWCFDDPRLAALKPKGISYGFSEGANWRLSHFRQTEKGILFDVGKHTDIELSLFGRHNALNGAAVFCLALSMNIPEEIIRRAFCSFSGTARRLEKKGEKHKVTLYDDYGHHPKEITVTIEALRDHVRERRLIVVFQPHRYTRVRDHFESFANCFNEADVVFMTDIYSAGEPPIEGITSAALYTLMREKLGPKLHFLPRTHLEAGVAAALKPLDVVLTIGAGDVTQAGLPILDNCEALAPKWTVGVLFGGSSAEHPVSLMSARNIIGGLDPSVYEIKLFGVTTGGEWVYGSDAMEKVAQKTNGPKIDPSVWQELTRCDVCIPVFHGPQGEDGMMGAILDALSIPYVGCDYRSGALCMQKTWTKSVARSHSIPTAPFVEFDTFSYRREPNVCLEEVEEKLSYPLYVKPVHLGSSIGVSRARNREELIQSLELALSYDDTVIVEREIEGRQIEFSIVGNDYVKIAPPGEIMSQESFVGYDKKYGSSALEIRVPAPITESEMALGLELAEKMYRVAGCKGLARVDFFLDRQGQFWFNEINPFPGCTDTSAFPKSWAAIGYGMTQIVDELLALAFQRSRRLSQIRGKQ